MTGTPGDAEVIEAAVDAAELAQRRHLRRTNGIPDGEFFSCPDQSAVRAAVEAALPIIERHAAAKAWDEGLAVGVRYLRTNPEHEAKMPPNPYRAASIEDS